MDRSCCARRTDVYINRNWSGRIVTGKKVIIFSHVAVVGHGAAKAMDFHETYLRKVLGFIGLSNINFIHTERMAMGEEAVASALLHSRSTMTELIPA
ncbi:NAD(P)H-dependent oxidoreductase [Glaciimonas immobilis]|nr:NAD(P)H-dependent oxidoreductase [Glaciimonas immobilis]KAF3999466.1 hypothetical protein HAV38_05995 [Glaciimonas immobilis]